MNDLMEMKRGARRAAARPTVAAGLAMLDPYVLGLVKQAERQLAETDGILEMLRGMGQVYADHARASREIREAIDRNLDIRNTTTRTLGALRALQGSEVGGRRSEVGDQVADGSRGGVLLTSDLCPLTSPAKGGRA